MLVRGWEEMIPNMELEMEMPHSLMAAHPRREADLYTIT